jgi:hypothetical protein
MVHCEGLRFAVVVRVFLPMTLLNAKICGKCRSVRDEQKLIRNVEVENPKSITMNYEP